MADKDLSANRRRRTSAELRRSRSRVAPATKKWKHVYTRSAKVTRARQLGFEYPKRTDRQLRVEYVASGPFPLYLNQCSLLGDRNVRPLS